MGMHPPLALTILVGIFAVFRPAPIAGQKCGCNGQLCCSRWGHCGTGNAYCGDGCRQGPCYATHGVPVADIVTLDFFVGIINRANGSCPRKTFYTRDAFLSALVSYPGFGKSGTAVDSRREVAAFFAHVTQETGHFCYVEEIDGPSKNYCKPSNQFPCVPGKGYYGRGPIQLSWNYNYGAAGLSIGFDGLSSPETVANDAIISFKTALWYWMKYVHSAMVGSQGFGATIRAINGAVECNGNNTAAMQARVHYYKNYCRKLQVLPGDNLTC